MHEEATIPTGSNAVEYEWKFNGLARRHHGTEN